MHPSYQENSYIIGRLNTKKKKKKKVYLSKFHTRATQSGMPFLEL